MQDHAFLRFVRVRDHHSTRKLCSVMATCQTVQETEGDWTSSEMPLIRGVRFVAGLVDPNFHEDIERFHTKSDDVFVASYPRSGTIWTIEILWQIYNNGLSSNIPIKIRVPWLEENPLLRTPELDSFPVSKPVIDLLPSPRLLFSHMPYHAFPKGKDDLMNCKYIYVARNPKDVAVSLYQLALALGIVPGMTWDIFLKNFLQGKLYYNLWSDHVLGWWKHKDDPNVLFLKYEDLKKDLPSNVRKIAEFVNKPLSEEVIQRIAHQCSFKEMNKNKPVYKVLPDVKDNDASLLRKGEVGDWKNHFTPEVNERFETELLAVAREHGLEFE